MESIFWPLLFWSGYFDRWASQLSGQESGAVPKSRAWKVPLGFPATQLTFTFKLRIQVKYIRATTFFKTGWLWNIFWFRKLIWDPTIAFFLLLSLLIHYVLPHPIHTKLFLSDSKPNFIGQLTQSDRLWVPAPLEYYCHSRARLAVQSCCSQAFVRDHFFVEPLEPLSLHCLPCSTPCKEPQLLLSRISMTWQIYTGKFSQAKMVLYFRSICLPRRWRQELTLIRDHLC